MILAYSGAETIVLTRTVFVFFARVFTIRGTPVIRIQVSVIANLVFGGLSVSADVKNANAFPARFVFSARFSVFERLPVIEAGVLFLIALFDAVTIIQIVAVRIFDARKLTKRRATVFLIQIAVVAFFHVFRDSITANI